VPAGDELPDNRAPLGSSVLLATSRQVSAREKIFYQFWCRQRSRFRFAALTAVEAGAF
jgi:hypothetical protein